MLASSAGPAAATLENLYINRRHGIAFLIPPSWEFLSVMEFGQIQAGIQLEIPEDIDPDLFHSLFRERVLNDDNIAPIVWAADMPRMKPIPGVPMSPIAAIAPAISVRLEGTWWDDDGPEPDGPPDLLGYAKHDLQMFQRRLPGCGVLEVPKPMRVSGCDAVDFLFRYHHAHEDIYGTVLTRQRTLYALQDPFIYSFGMVDYPDLDPPLTHDFTAFIDSICIM